MKQRINYDEWIALRQRRPNLAGKLFGWAASNRYVSGGDIYLPTVGELIHFLSDCRRVHFDDILSGVHDNVLTAENITIAWDGKELLDILWWQVCQDIAKL